VDNVNDPDPTTRLRRFSRVARGALADTRPLRTPDYRRLWTAGIVTVVGAQLTVVAVPTQIFTLTGSSAYVGLTGLFGLVPLIVFGLWGGAIADAVDRRTLLLVTGAGIAAMSLALWVIAASGVGNVWVVLVLFAVQTALLAVNQPTRSAVIPRLVTPALLPAANTLNFTVFQLGAFVGPLLAGVLIPVIGLPTLYLLDAVALLATLWATWRLPAMPPAGEQRARAGLRDVVAGFRYAAMHKVLLVSFLADIIAMAFGMPRILFPEMAERTFGDPPGGGFALGGRRGPLLRLPDTDPSAGRCGVGVDLRLGPRRRLVRAHQRALARRAPAGHRRGGRPRQRRVPLVDAADRRHRRDARAYAGRVHGGGRRWAAGGRPLARRGGRRRRAGTGRYGGRPRRDRRHGGRGGAVPRVLALPRASDVSPHRAQTAASTLAWVLNPRPIRV
jgi:hypothetical protein